MRVDVQDVGLLDFPDDASEQEIQDLLNESFPGEQKTDLPTMFSGWESQPEIPSYVPSTGIPEISESLAPQIDWQQRAKSESFVPSKAELQEGVLSTAGVTPEIIPSGRRMAESPLARSAFGLVGAFAPEVPATVASSVGKTALGIGEYLSSPQGVTELVASMTPARLLVLGKWATDMAKGAGQEAGTLSNLVQKPNKTPEDWQEISDHTVNTLAMTFGSGATAKGAAGGIKSIAQKLNMPEGKFRVEDRGDVAQNIFNQFELERQLQAGSPFVRREAAPQEVSMGMRTQPILTEAYDPFRPTFDPSGMRLSGAVEAPLTGSLQPPQPPMAPGARPVTANQLKIIQDSLQGQLLEGQIGKKGVLSGTELEAWADRVFQDAKDQNLRFSGGDTRMLAASIVKGAAILERGITDLAKWTSEMVKEFGEGIRPFLEQIRGQAEELRSPSKIGGALRPAVRAKTGEIITAIDHGTAQIQHGREGRLAIESERPQDFGFLDESGNFLTRTEAVPVFEKTYGKKPSDPNRVTSEDLKAEAKSAEVKPAESAAKQEEIIKPQEGERLVELVSPDGTAETVAFGDKYWDFPGQGKLPSIARWTGKGWSHGMAKPGQKIQELATPESEAVIESVTALDPQSGSVLSATESLINRLESLKFAEAGEGRLYSLPHPDAIKAIGRTTWNSAVDAAIAAMKAGKTIAEAIESAIAYIKTKSSTFDEAKARANIEYVANRETRPEQPQKTAPAAESVQPPSEAKLEVKDPVTGEPAKMVTEAAAKAMERKVKLPAETDVKKLTEQINLFNKEIGDALESGGQFLPKEMRPDVAKGAPAEKGTVTNKEINQYFVNKLSSIRKDMQATKQRIAQQADVESQIYFDLLQKRFEQSFRQVQELRRTSSEALYFWNKIRAEYQAIAQAAGAMPEMKRQLPILDQIWKDMRDKNYPQAGRHLVDYLRMNLFTLGSWTLDFGTNLVAAGSRVPAWAIMDMGALVTGNAPTRMFTAMRALADNTKNWNPLGKRFRLPDKIEQELGNTAGGEFGGKGREVIVDFSEILKSKPEMAEKLRHIDKLIGAPVRMKRAVDGFFGRFGATAELYNRAYMEGKTRGLKGDDLKRFTEEFVQNPPQAAINRALKTGKEFKFNRDLTKLEEAFANNVMTKVFVEAFPRWTLQFIRWGGEMVGVDPAFLKKAATGKATPEEFVNYLTKAATGWGGIYAFNQLFYDNIDANSMEYVKEDGNRVRLAGRTPAPELFFIVAMLRGDTEKAKAALSHLSLPGAKLLSGEPAGLISPLVDTIRESIRGRYTMEQTSRELTKLVNDAIPGKSVLGLIRAFFDPTIREGIGAPIPGVSSLLPQPVDPTTGEPRAPKQRIPGTSIEIPTVAGTPFPGAERVLNDVESALLDHGLGISRPRRTSIIDLPAEDVPKNVRKEYEQMVGRNVKELLGEEIKSKEFWAEEFEWRREILQRLLTEARAMARDDIADKYGAEGESVQSTPLNIQRLPNRLK